MTLYQTPETGTINIANGQLAYDITGEGDWLLLIHAGIADRRMWDPQLPALSRYFRVLRYDLRGFGQSSAPSAPFSHHDDARELLHSLGIERAHVVALSMGASIALDLTLAWPEAVDRLVLSSVLGPPPRSQSLIDGWAAAERAYEEGGLEAVNEVEMRIWVDGPQRGPDEVDREVRRLVAGMNLPVLQAEEQAEFESTPLEPPAHTRLNNIQAPALVITGDIDQPDVIQYTARLAAEIPRGRLATIAGAAHMVNMEAADEFNRLVIDFLTE